MICIGCGRPKSHYLATYWSSPHSSQIGFPARNLCRSSRYETRSPTQEHAARRTDKRSGGTHLRPLSLLGLCAPEVKIRQRSQSSETHEYRSDSQNTPSRAPGSIVQIWLWSRCLQVCQTINVSQAGPAHHSCSSADTPWKVPFAIAEIQLPCRCLHASSR